MALSSAKICSTLTLFSSFVFIISATSDENRTSGDFNSSTPNDKSVIYNVTDNYTTPEPTVFESTTPTVAYNSKEEPVLPVSGRLLTPVTNVDRLCPCDEKRDMCNINCCCDRKCNKEVALFTSCSVTAVSGIKQLCSYDVAYYTLRTTIDGYSELQSSVLKEANYDIFCIQSHNRVDGLSHPSPALPAHTNFESLFKHFTSFIFGSVSSNQVLPAEVQSSPGYQFGDVMVTAGENSERQMFYLPARGVTSECLDNSPAAFLKDQSCLCSRRLVLDRDCSSLPALSKDTYSNIQLFAGKNTDAEVVDVEASVIVQSTEGTQTELTVGSGDDLSPVLLSPTLCANVVLKVIYVIKYNSAGEVVNAVVSVVLGFVRETAKLLEQEFRIMYIQEYRGDLAVHYSGNPGYVVGLPIVSGARTTDGIKRNLNLRDTLSLLHSTQGQDCLRCSHRRSPVLFGLDSVSGCTLRLEDVTNCSLVSQLLLDVLRGQNFPQYVASFGNSPLDSQLDWVQIKSNHPVETQSCNIPLSLHFEIEWTKYGSLVNPQVKIVSIKEVIQTNTSNLALLSGTSGVLPIRSSVAFIPISAAALPGYRATPTINAKLPFDFFFPFV
ncbi:tectonic-1 [Leuresthes tenuis]|uniref:tectonic-1 n=1 Tax=Leuresthes tenuis TaxID=355514 RepID=UPI003B506DEA